MATVQYITTINTSVTVKNDDRATIGQQNLPISFDVADGPTIPFVSGIRCNDDQGGFSDLGL